MYSSAGDNWPLRQCYNCKHEITSRQGGARRFCRCIYVEKSRYFKPKHPISLILSDLFANQTLTTALSQCKIKTLSWENQRISVILTCQVTHTGLGSPATCEVCKHWELLPSLTVCFIALVLLLITRLLSHTLPVILCSKNFSLKFSCWSSQQNSISGNLSTKWGSSKVNFHRLSKAYSDLQALSPVCRNIKI